MRFAVSARSCSRVACQTWVMAKVLLLWMSSWSSGTQKERGVVRTASDWFEVAKCESKFGRLQSSGLGCCREVFEAAPQNGFRLPTKKKINQMRKDGT